MPLKMAQIRPQSILYDSSDQFFHRRRAVSESSDDSDTSRHDARRGESGNSGAMRLGNETFTGLQQVIRNALWQMAEVSSPHSPSFREADFSRNLYFVFTMSKASSRSKSIFSRRPDVTLLKR